MRTYAYRKLGWGDWLSCWKLARDDEVRQNSLNHKKPGPMTHHMWMHRWVRRKNGEHAYVILLDDASASWRMIGLFRSAAFHDGREVSIALCPEARGQGHAARVLWLMSPLEAQHGPVYARILSHNMASFTSFYRAGYHLVDMKTYEEINDPYATTLRWSRDG